MLLTLLKLSQDQVKLGEDSFEHTKKHAKDTIDLSKDQFKKNQELTRAVADRADRRTVEGQVLQKMQSVLHTFWTHNQYGTGYFDLKEGDDGKTDARSTAAVKYYREGWAALAAWGKDGFSPLKRQQRLKKGEHDLCHYFCNNSGNN